MKKRLLVLFVLVAQVGISQIFTEDFENTGGALPAGWTVINNDGLTPDANVAQFTDAWIVAADFDNTTDTVAMSTSWYSPAGTSDDWLITPAINLTTANILTFEEEAQDANFPDGYELRISTTTPTIAGFNANPALLTVAAANGAAWLTRTVDLDAAGYSNQTVYLAWRNNSTDQFILMIDDIDISVLPAYDVAMTDTTLKEYTLIPESQAQTIGNTGLISNVGGGAVTNANMTVNVYDGTMTNVYSGTSNTIASIAPGASSAVTATGYTPVTPDVYTVELISNITETDSDLTNDTTYYTYVVTDSIYARDDGTVTGSLGVGAGTTGQLGQAFEVNVTDDITSVSMFITNAGLSMNGQPLSADIYATDATGTPTTVLVSTDIVTVDTTTNNLWTIPIAGGSYTLSPGNYVIVANEPDSNVTLGTTNAIFTPGKTWVIFGTNPWDNNEGYGIFNTYVLRANFACPTTTSNITASTCDVSYTSPSGNYTWTTSGIYNDTLVNAGGCDSLMTIDLTFNTETTSTIAATGCTSYTSPSGNYTWTVDGQYMDTIPNAAGCDSVMTINLTLSEIINNQTMAACDTYTSPSGNYTWTTSGIYNDTLMAAGGCDSILIIDLTIDAVDITVSEANNVITANQAGATYQWIDCGNGNAIIPGETSQAYMPSANGDYAVIVTNGSCVDTSACTTISTIGIDETAFSAGIDIYPNPSNGVFTVTVNDLPIGELKVEVMDTRGRILLTTTKELNNGNGNIPVNLYDVDAGVYFVNLIAGDKRVTERIVISKK